MSNSMVDWVNQVSFERSKMQFVKFKVSHLPEKQRKKFLAIIDDAEAQCDIEEAKRVKKAAPMLTLTDSSAHKRSIERMFEDDSDNDTDTKTVQTQKRNGFMVPAASNQPPSLQWLTRVCCAQHGANLFAKANKEAISKEGFQGREVLQEGTRRYSKLNARDQLYWTAKADKMKQEFLEKQGLVYKPGKKLLALQLMVNEEDKVNEDSASDDDVPKPKKAKKTKKAKAPDSDDDAGNASDEDLAKKPKKSKATKPPADSDDDAGNASDEDLAKKPKKSKAPKPPADSDDDAGNASDEEPAELDE